MAKVIVGLYLVWRNRNNVVHGQQGWTMDFCKFKASCLQNQFSLRRLPGLPKEHGNEEDSSDGWEFFCDGSFWLVERSGGWAAVARRNNMIWACRADFSKVCRAGLQAEINDILMGLKLAAFFKSKRATIYSDSTEAIWVLQRGMGHENLHIDGLTESVQLLKDNPGWDLRYVFRESNRDADFLAKKANREEWKWDRCDALPSLPGDFVTRGTGNHFQ